MLDNDFFAYAVNDGMSRVHMGELFKAVKAGFRESDDWSEKQDAKLLKTIRHKVNNIRREWVKEGLVCRDKDKFVRAKAVEGNGNRDGAVGEGSWDGEAHLADCLHRHRELLQYLPSRGREAALRQVVSILPLEHSHQLLVQFILGGQQSRDCGADRSAAPVGLVGGSAGDKDQAEKNL